MRRSLGTIPNLRIIHGELLRWLTLHPVATIPQIGDALGVSERHAHRLVTELREAACISVARQPKHSVYRINRGVELLSRES